MRRIVQPEILDSLSPSDPRAIHSRRDLRLINLWMGNARHLRKAFSTLDPPPRSILELGTGDGTLMAKLSHAFPAWKPEVILLDRTPVVSNETLRDLITRGWNPRVLAMDLRDWLRRPDKVDLIVANLFLHHLSEDEIRTLFAAMATTTRAFICCEPRRWAPSLITSRLLWLLGCNRVTRYDARVSIRAGFRGRELSPLWPPDFGFDLQEHPAGYASHLFVASRRGAPIAGTNPASALQSPRRSQPIP